MSLQVWLPLNGDLHNQGCSNITIINNSATVNDSGKIGKCYYFAASQYLKESTYDWSNFNTSTFSLCCWYKEPSPVASGNSQIICIGTNSGWNNIRIGLLRRSSSGYPMFSVSDGSSAIQYSCTSNTWTLDTWNHIAVTYNSGTVSMYINGILDKTYTTTITPVLNSSQHLGIGAASNGAEKLTGYLNDIRIYDHCLSAAEVREISQGLVLHYKLDSIDIKTGTNLVTSITPGGQTSSLTDGRLGVKTSGTNADTYFSINLSESIVAGTSYFLSCDASGISAGQYWGFPLGQQNNGTLPFKIYNGHNEYAFTANDTLPNGNAMNWGTNRLFMDDNYRQDYTNQAQFYNFQLIKIGTGTELIVKDSSGYNNNGIINSILKLDTNSSRYNLSSYFNGTDTAIKIPFNDCIKTDDYTVSVWTYKTVIGTKGYQTILGGPSGFELEARSSSTTDPLYRIHNWGGGTTPYEFNKWNLFTFVRTASNSKLYVNGELKITGNAGSAPPTGDYFIGAWKTATSQNYDGWMSDFRLYSTALDADAIRQLYEVDAKVDNKQNLHTFELNEINSNIFAGKMWSSSYGSHTPLTAPFTNYNTKGEPQFTTNGTSAGSEYIKITPGVYEYDYTISVNTGNQFYIGIERYDANKTSRSNNACVYTTAIKPTTDIVKQRYKGTVTLTTDGTNTIDTITLRILNGWSGTTSGVTGIATIHNFSLKLQSTSIDPSLKKTGQFLAGEFKEYNKASFYENHIVEAAEFIEL